MPLQIIRNDITKVQCDAIVNAANSSLLGGGGVDGAIHKAAGKKLLLECMTLGGCKTGKAKITKGYKLPAKYVIHTVGPVWKGGKSGEEALLRSCYRECLSLAKEYGCESLAFPLISSGVYGYPKDEALKIAVEEITAFLLSVEMLIYIVVFDKSAFRISEMLFSDISAYIDDKYVEENLVSSRREPGFSEPLHKAAFPAFDFSSARFKAESEALKEQDAVFEDISGFSDKDPTLEEAIGNIDESFSEMLLRKIDESSMSDAECYKKANIDRKLFSKIRSDKYYKPSKPTVLAFAIALELPLSETKDMLMKAGFALSHSSKFDIIIEYFITHGNYNIFEINDALFAFDQNLLGA
ncbi:MAG: O-acetyl-ADP-ribose deacetylase [Acutalibacteraceae bacterium]